MEKELKAAATADYSQLHAVNDGYIRSASGKKVFLHHPTADMIELTDIATGLGNYCRFGGQLSHFFSVAQHSILVLHLTPADRAPYELMPYALLHDAAEAYLGDVIKPIKVILGDVYKQMERNFHVAICERFHLDPDAPEWTELKQYDRQAVEIEYSWLKKGHTAAAPAQLRQWMLSAWSPKLAIERFHHYCFLLNIQ